MKNTTFQNKTPVRHARDPFNYHRSLAQEVVAGVAATYKLTVVHSDEFEPPTSVIAALAIAVADKRPTLIARDIQHMPVTIFSSRPNETSNALRAFEGSRWTWENNGFPLELIDAPRGLVPKGHQLQAQSLVILDRLKPHGLSPLLNCGHALLAFAMIGERWRHDDRRACLYTDKSEARFAFRDRRGAFSHEIAIRLARGSAR